MASSSSLFNDGHDSTSDLMDMFFSDNFSMDDEGETKEEITPNKSQKKIQVEETPGKTEESKIISKETKTKAQMKSITEDGKPPPQQVPKVQEVKGPDNRLTAKLAGSRKPQNQPDEKNEAKTTKSGSQALNDFDARIAAKLAGSRGMKNQDNATTSISSVPSTSSGQRPGVQEVKNADNRIAAKLASAGNSRLSMKSAASARNIDERITAKLASNKMIEPRSDGSHSNRTLVTTSRTGYFTRRADNRSNRRLMGDNGSENNSRGQPLDTESRIAAKLAAYRIGSDQSHDDIYSRSGAQSSSSMQLLDKRIKAKLSENSSNTSIGSSSFVSNRSDPNSRFRNSSMDRDKSSKSEALREVNTTYDQKMISKLRENEPNSNNDQESRSQDRRLSLESTSINNISLRSRISDLSTPHADDLVENVFGERIDSNPRRLNDYKEEKNSDHNFITNDSNGGRLRNESNLTPIVDVENSRASGLQAGGESSNYLKTQSVHVEYIEDKKDLASALHYSNSIRDKQNELKQDGDEVSCLRLKTCLICIIFIAIISTIVVMTVARPGSSSPTMTPLPRRQIVYQDMYDFLSLQNGVNASLLGNKTSPQAQSLNWLVYSDGLELVPNVNETTDQQIVQRYALMTNYYSIDSVFRINLKWGASKSECQWDEKIICKTIQFQENNIFQKFDSVVKLRLENLQFTEKLVNDTGLLSKLEYLSLRDTSINSPLPEYIFRLSRLEYLDLSYNKLESSMDERISNLSNLRTLRLGYCGLTGTIPNSILHGLTNLEFFSLAGNKKLQGEIFPFILRSKEKIEFVDASNNMFNDSIPTEIFHLKNLKELNLSRNQIQGSIPTELGNMNNLESISLWENEVTGTIPSEIGKLINLKYVILERNDLGSTIPTELGKLDKLMELILSWNSLSGPIPTEFGKLNQLMRLRLEGNDLISIPDSFQNLTNLELMTLQYNNIGGEMPQTVCDLKTSSKLVIVESDCAVKCGCCNPCY